MGYLFLFAAILAGSIKGFCGKKSSTFVQGTKDAVLINTVRMICCILIGGALILLQKGSFQITPRELMISALSGVSVALFTIFWLLGVRLGSFMMLDVFLMLGVLIPMLGSRILFAEPILLKQWIGVAVLILAVCLMCSYNISLKGKMSAVSLILAILCGVMNGFLDFSQKMFIYKGEGASAAAFNFFAYIFAFSVLALFLIILSLKKEKNPERVPMPGKVYFYVIIMALCLFLHSYCKTLAAETISAAKLYPLNQGMSLIFALIMSAVFFGEKPNKRCVAGVGLAFVALLLINVL